MPDKETLNLPPRKVYSDKVQAVYAKAVVEYDADTKAGKTRKKNFKELRGTTK
jgi:hypothetical protein